MRKYSLVVGGGTFDHFHKGHERFLLFLLSLGHKVLLGVTSDSYVRKKIRGKPTENFPVRKQAVYDFLRKKKAENRVKISKIDDVFIPKKWQELPIEAIGVTKHSKNGAERINQKRERDGLFPLPICVCPLIFADDGNLLSSSRVRDGEISKSGKSYLHSSLFKKELQLPPSTRKKLKRPINKLYTHFDASVLKKLSKSTLFTVGDVVTKTCNQLGFPPQIAVVDFKVARKRRFTNTKELGFSGKEMALLARNPPGKLTPSLFRVLVRSISASRKGRVIVFVDGEEDLAVLPLILVSPLGCFILYGQPQQGVVAVEVTAALKEQASKIIATFL